MSELQNRSSGDSASTVQIIPPDIVRRRVVAWGGVRAEVIELIRRDQFEYKFHALHHLLIMSERASRDDGETMVDGLPIATARNFGRKLTLVPAGHQLHGWQKPRALTRVTYFYIDPHNTLLGSEGCLADVDLKPRPFFFDSDLWETTAKLKAQAGQQVIGQRTYGEALCVVLVHELVRLNSGTAGATHLLRGGLAGWQKNQLRDYIEEAATPIHLGSRALDMLVALLERPRELVSKEELMAKVWPNTCVVPTDIAVHILALRRALGDGLRGSRLRRQYPRTRLLLRSGHHSREGPSSGSGRRCAGTRAQSAGPFDSPFADV